MSYFYEKSRSSIALAEFVMILVSVNRILSFMTEPFTIQLLSAAVVSGQVPELFEDDRLAGAGILSVTGSNGNLMVQSAHVRGISLYYIRGDLTQPLKLSLGAASSVVFLNIQMQGTLEVMHREESFRLSRTNHASLLYLPRFASGLTLTGSLPETGFTSLILGYPLSLVRELLNHYPWLSHWNTALEEDKPFLYAGNGLGATLAENTYQLLHVPFLPMTQDHHYRLLRESLTEVLKEAVPDVPAHTNFSRYDIDCIHAAREYIDAHLSEHHTLGEIARVAGTNECKLKRGFKAIYGSGVYGYLLLQRMRIAALALEKTLRPVGQIARAAGYRNPSNFSSAFKRAYGISPHRYRRQKRGSG